MKDMKMPNMRKAECDKRYENGRINTKRVKSQNQKLIIQRRLEMQAVTAVAT